MNAFLCKITKKIKCIIKLCAAIWQDFGHPQNRPPISLSHTIECVWERRTSMFPVLDTNLWSSLFYSHFTPWFQSKIPSKSKSHLLTEFFWLLPGIWKNISESAWLKGRDENHRKHIAEGLKKDGFLVPISKSKLGPEWALHFPKAEQEILWNLGCAKPVIRFLKQFRDARGITKLKVGTKISSFLSDLEIPFKY